MAGWLKKMIFGDPPKAVSIITPPPPPVVHTLRHPKNEVSVMSHVNGFYLFRADTCEYYVKRYLASDHAVYEWNREREYREYRNSHYLYVFKTKEAAVAKAILLEQGLDYEEDERIRRANFVEEKVWR